MNDTHFILYALKLALNAQIVLKKKSLKISKSDAFHFFFLEAIEFSVSLCSTYKAVALINDK